MLAKYLIIAISAVVVVATSIGPAHASKEAKLELHGKALVLTLAGIHLQQSGDPIDQAQSEVLLDHQATWFRLSGILDSIPDVRNRPDPNHNLPPPQPNIQFRPVNGSGPVIDIMNHSLDVAGDVMSDSIGLEVSLQRYYGAVADNDTADIALQRFSASKFLTSLENSLLAYSSAMQAMSIALQGTPFAALSFNSGQLIAFRDQIVSTGFPPEEDFAFAQMNSTPEDIARAVNEVALATDALLTGPDITGATVLAAFGTGLLAVNVRDFLPVDFQALPEPATMLLFGIGAVGLLASRAGRRMKARFGVGCRVGPAASVAAEA